MVFIMNTPEKNNKEILNVKQEEDCMRRVQTKIKQY